MNLVRRTYANKARESVRRSPRRPSSSSSETWATPVSNLCLVHTLAEESVAMDADDADPDREEKLKAAKEKVSYVYKV